jgi:hypothetical protein
LSRDNVFTPVGVINCCCAQSRAYGIWLLLARFDDEEMRIKRAIVDITNKRGKASKTGKKSGVGYAGGSAGYGGFYLVGGAYPHSHAHATAVATKSEGGDVAGTFSFSVNTLRISRDLFFISFYTPSVLILTPYISQMIWLSKLFNFSRGSCRLILRSQILS